MVTTCTNPCPIRTYVRGRLWTNVCSVYCSRSHNGNTCSASIEGIPLSLSVIPDQLGQVFDHRPPCTIGGYGCPAAVNVHTTLKQEGQSTYCIPWWYLSWIACVVAMAYPRKIPVRSPVTHVTYLSIGLPEMFARPVACTEDVCGCFAFVSGSE